MNDFNMSTMRGSSTLTKEQIAYLRKKYEPIKKLSLHDDADGVSAAVLLSYAFKINKVWAPEDFGEWPITPYQVGGKEEIPPDVCVDMVPADPRWAGLCFVGSTPVIYETNGKISISPFIELRRIKTLKALEGNVRKLAKFIKLPKVKMVELVLKNGEKMVCTWNHLFPTNEGLIQAKDLKGKFLFISEEPIQTGDLGSKELGYFLGLYLAGGSLTGNHCQIANKNKELLEKASKFLQSIGLDYQFRKNEGTGVWTLASKSKTIKALINHFIGGNSARTKFLKQPCYNLSLEARKSLLQGLYDGDGRQGQKCIGSTSKRLRDTIRNLCTTLGLPVSIRDYEYPQTPEYRISFGKQNRCFKRIDNKLGVEVLEVKDYESHGQFVYCLEIIEGEPYFLLGNGILTHNCIDHHPSHPPEGQRNYQLIYANVPTAIIVYTLFKDVIPKEQRWKAAVGAVGDGQPELIPPEIWREYPILLEESVSTWERYGKIETTCYPLYLRLSSGINAICKIPEKWYVAYSTLRNAKSPWDLINDVSLRSAKDIIDGERSKVYRETGPIQLRNGIRIWAFQSEYKIERAVAWEMWEKDKRTVIAINTVTGRGSIRGTLATLVYEHLSQYGFRAAGHPGFGGIRLKPNQTFDDVYHCLANLKL